MFQAAGSARHHCLRGTVVLLLSLTACGPGVDSYLPNQPTGYNVILVTLDGVRWQEFFRDSDPLLAPTVTPLFPLVRGKLMPRGQAYGNPYAHSEMATTTIANASLPGYMSIFSEKDHGCLNNFCGRIREPTFVDRLHDELDFAPADLTVFASWPKLALAVTGRDDVAQVTAGDYEGLGDFAAHPEHALLEDTLEFDNGTVLEGFRYLSEHNPRFLYLSFLDSDRYAHQNRYDRYLDVLGTYDRLLSTLIDRLDQKGAYGENTALIIATDHGRGNADQWTEHGPHAPASHLVWAYVMLPKAATGLALVDPSSRNFTHHDIRYTIETLLGLSTRSSSGASTGFIEK